MGYLSKEGKIGPKSIAGYVSGVNSYCNRVGLPAPALMGPQNLHPAVKAAQTGYIRQCMRKRPQVEDLGATPFYVIAKMAAACARSVSCGDRESARCCFSQIWRYYTFDRHTSCASTLNEDFCISGRIARITRKSLATGRKRKEAPTVTLERRAPPEVSGTHPILLLDRYTGISSVLKRLNRCQNGSGMLCTWPTLDQG